MIKRINTQLVNGEIYHIVIRAIDGINLFKDKKDFLRMIHDLFEFNDLGLISSTFRVLYHRSKNNVTLLDNVTLDENTRKGEEDKRKRRLLVEILAFCLMPNHVHLLLRQVRNNGISKFFQKLCGGYARYYNRRHKRKGHLFQGKYQAVHIKNNDQLKTVFVYLHTNPVAIIYSKWKQKGIKNLKKAIRFVENYRWSSYPDYLGIKNFPSLTMREFLVKVMEGKDGCRRFINGWLSFKRGLADFEKIAIE